MIQQSIDRMSMLIQKHRRTCIAVMFLCLYSVSISFAAPLYTSSNTTLDPQCAPTDTNCTVQPIAVTGALTYSGGAISLSPASPTQAGYLSADDWNTFNNKVSSQWTTTGNDIVYSNGNILLSASNGYVNFGTTSGSAGYGIRDNGGTLQYKNNAGSWVSVGAIDPSSTLQATNLIITGTVTVDAPTNLTVQQSCIDVCAYTTRGAAFNYRVYAYKNTNSGRIYSSSYATLQSDFIDDNSGSSYSLTLTWDPVAGADGYRILRYSNYAGATNNYDAGFDTGATFYDDTSPYLYSEFFNPALTAVTPTTAVGGSTSLSGSLSLNNNSIKATGSQNYGMGSNIGIGVSDTVFFGLSTGLDASVSNANFFGRLAGADATNANNSNFFGYYAGFGATEANNSNFFGYQAGEGVVNANNSNFFGQNAGNNADEASNANFFGYYAGRSAGGASNSIFIGKSAGNNDTVNNTGNTDNFSILIGPNTNTGGFSNSIALGGYAVNTATNQFMLGSSTRPITQFALNGTNAYLNFLGQTQTTGSSGYGFRDNGGALEIKHSSGSWGSILSGSGSVGNIPYFTSTATLTGSSTFSLNTTTNTLNIGSLTIGRGSSAISSNIAIGTSMPVNTSGVENTVIGNSAYLWGNGRENTVMGFSAMMGTNATPNTGGYNTAIGAWSLYSNINGASNVAVGNSALAYFNTNGNTAIGNNSMLGSVTVANNTGYWNTAVGGASLRNMTTGYQNTAIGIDVMRNATTAFNNVAIGGYAFRHISDPASGTYTASGGVAIGYEAGRYQNGTTTGLFGTTNSIYIGQSTKGVLNETNAIVIGSAAQSLGSNTFAIGNTSTTFGRLWGRVLIGTSSDNGYSLQVGSNAVSGIVSNFTNSTGTCTINPTTTSLSCSSDMNLKKDITVLRTNTTWNYTQHITTQDTPLLDKVLSLQPVRYHWNTESSQDTLHTGFIAQDIEQLFPELVTTDTSTGYKTLNQLGLLPYTIAAVQELAVKVQAIPTFSDTSLYTTIATFLDGIAQRGEAVLTKVQTKELCVDDVCVTKDQFRAMVQQSLQQSQTVIMPANTTTPVVPGVSTETIAPTAVFTTAPTIETVTEPTSEPAPQTSTETVPAPTPEYSSPQTTTQ